jgi:hypothetical protein
MSKIQTYKLLKITQKMEQADLIALQQEHPFA